MIRWSPDAASALINAKPSPPVTQEKAQQAWLRLTGNSDKGLWLTGVPSGDDRG